MALDATQLHAAQEGVLQLSLPELALLQLEGPDVADYLQRVCSQDAEGLAVGQSAPACLLTGKGKMLALFRLLRVREDLFLAETQREHVGELRELLDRFIFTERIELTVRDDLTCHALLGPRATSTALGVQQGGFCISSDELGVPFVRWHAPLRAIETERSRLADEGVVEGQPAILDAMRIDAGWPRLGVDADDTTIPLEVGLDEACHAEKGCYTGQEVVARIRTYGHVNRSLMRVRFDGEEAFAPGSLIFDEGMEAGRLTSSYASPVDGSWHGLALLPLAVTEDDSELRIGREDGPKVTLVD